MGTTGYRRLVASVALSLLGTAPLALLGLAGAAAPLLRAGSIVVTNLNTDSVSIITPTTHAVSTISGHGLNGPMGVAITPDGRTAYVTNSLGNSIVPITLATSSVGAPVRVGSAPAAIAIASNGRTAYVSNFNDNTVTPVSLGATPLAGRPIPVGAGPWSIAVSSDGSTVLVSDSEGDAVSVIDVATRHVTNLPIGARPQAIAIAPDGTRAFVVDGQAITVIALGPGTASIARVVPVAAGPVGIAISPSGERAYTANANGTLSVFSPRDLAVVPTTVSVANLTQPDGMALSPDGRIVYVASASGDVAPIDVSASPIHAIGPIPMGSPVFGIAIEPDQAPVALLKVTPAKAGHPSTLNASASYAPNGTIRDYHWSFGDGTSLTSTTPLVHHVYTRGGSYQASVVVVTIYGTSTATTFTGQMVSNRGAATASTLATFKVPSALELSPAKGAPGIGVRLVDNTIGATCNPAYVFFDGNLIASSPVTGHVLSIRHLVIPGNAAIGRHQIVLSCSTSLRPLVSASFSVVPTLNHLMEYSVAMPSLGQLSHHLVSAGGISVLLVLLGRLIAAGFPSDWLDHTYAANREKIFPGLRRHLRRFFYDANRQHTPWRNVIGGVVVFLAFVLIGGLVNSFLDPAFGLNRSSLWLFFGQSLGIGLITLTSQLPIAISGWRRRRKVHLQVLAGGIVIAMISVGLSRAVGLAPGYCYGLIASFIIVPGTTLREEGRLHALSESVVLVGATGAYLLSTVVFHTATQPNPSPWLLVLTPALQTMFLAGFASLAFGLFPLPFLPGRHVAKWNETVWYLLSGLGLIGFVAVLLSPGSGSQRELAHVGLVPLLTGFGIFSAISVGVMVFFRLRRDAADEEESEEAEEADELDGAEEPTTHTGVAPGSEH